MVAAAWNLRPRAADEQSLTAPLNVALYRGKRGGENGWSGREGSPRRGEPARADQLGFCAMGVLEDAIREHLELKRQHGASDEELEREQNEALGPPRRETAAEAQGEVGVVETPELPGEPELGEPEGSPPPAAEEAPVALDIPESPESAPPDFAGDFDAPPEAEPPLGDPPEDFVEQVAPRSEPEVPAYEPDEEPVGFDEEEPGVAPPMPTAAEPDEAPAEGGEGDDEDVLEDTPDFLEDTPEHDRLWFEQKPPRDFDFD